MKGEAGPTWWLAAHLLVDEETWIPGGAVRVEEGRVRSVRRDLPRRGRERVVDLRPAVLLPGLVDAHAHLDLTRAALPSRGGPFVPWLRRVVQARRRTDPSRAVREGADRLLAAGATTVVDVDGSGASAAVLARHGLRAVVLREVLGLRPAVAPQALRRARSWIARASPGGRVVRGLSPHAPYSVSTPLYRGLARLARRLRAPLATHLAETEEEEAFLLTGKGPLRAFLRERGALDPGDPPSGRRPLEILEAAGVLGRRTLLAHGNRLEAREARRIARREATVVLCPGTHLYFGRDEFPARRLERAGVRLALGTDGLASNDALDPFLEMARARDLEPAWAPEAVFRAATAGGAFPLGLARRVGRLRPGMVADAVAVDPPGSAGRRETLLDFVTSGRPRVREVFVAGRPAAGWRFRSGGL